MQKFLKRSSTGRLRVPVVVMALSGACLIASLSVLSALADNKAGKIATLSGEHQKQQFVVGERVEVTKVNVSDDIFVAGQDLIFETVSAKYVIAAGMSLFLKDVAADDLILAGGQMDLSGKVKDDVVAAACPFCPFGGRLHLTNTMQIGDDARLAGRDIIVDGRVGGDLYAAAQHFKLAGEVMGNAKIEAERIVLVPGARIGGDLLYTGSDKPEVPDGVVIAGQVRQVDSDLPFAKRTPRDWGWYGLLIVLGFLMALVLLGAMLQLAVPSLLSTAAATAVDKPWASLGRGLVVALLVPGAVALFMATIIGVPIGLVTMAAFVVLIALAFVSIAYCIGLFMRGLFGRKNTPSDFGSRFLWTAGGILILVVVGFIPFLGWAIGILAIIAGLGAAVSQLGPLFGRTGSMPAAP